MSFFYPSMVPVNRRSPGAAAPPSVSGATRWGFHGLGRLL